MSTHPFQKVKKALEGWQKKANQLRGTGVVSDGKIADVMEATIKACGGSANALHRILLGFREEKIEDAAEAVLEDLNDMADLLEEGLR